MLGTFTIEFDYNDFYRKLKHYFMDTAPIKVDLVAKASIVEVIAPNKSVTFCVDERVNVKENVYSLIKLCESSLYPRMIEETKVKRTLSVEERKKYLIKGYSLEEIENKSYFFEEKEFVITRVSIPSMTVVFKDLSRNRVFISRFHQPMFKILPELENLSAKEKFEFIKNNSDIQEITDEVRQNSY